MYLKKNHDKSIGASYIVWRLNTNKKADYWLRQSEHPRDVYPSFDAALAKAEELAMSTGDQYVIFKTAYVITPPPAMVCRVDEIN